MAQPRRDDALAAFLRADYDLCFELLKGQRGPERDLLMARALIRLRRDADARAVLEKSPAKGRSQWYAFMGSILGRSGDIDGGRAYLQTALDLARTPDERGGARYRQALLCWTERRLDEAERILAEGDFASSAGPAEELRAWLASERGDYAGAMRGFSRAASLARGDLLIEAGALSNAALHAREMYDPAVMEAVLRRASEISWSPYLGKRRFQITRYAAWLNAIEGDFSGAMQKICAAASFDDVSPEWRTYALCDRAYLSLVLGEEINGWATADAALTFADAIAWETCREGEHTVLLYLAGLFAVRRPDEARRCRERYDAVRPSDALRSTWVREPHVRAWEHFTDGLLAASAHDATTAAREFYRAFSIYQRIGYRWRAVLTLLALRDAGVSRPGYDEYVRTTLQRFPNSWLRDLAERELRTPLPLVAAA